MVLSVLTPESAKKKKDQDLSRGGFDPQDGGASAKPGGETDFRSTGKGIPGNPFYIPQQGGRGEIRGGTTLFKGRKIRVVLRVEEEERVLAPLPGD